MKIESPDAIIAEVTPGGIAGLAAGAGAVDELLAEGAEWWHATVVAVRATVRRRKGRPRVIVDE